MSTQLGRALLVRLFKDQDLIIWGSVLAFFHLTEGLFAYVQHGKRLSRHSLLFSRPYLLAMTAATVEHLSLSYQLDSWLHGKCPQSTICTTLFSYTRSIGLLLCLCGEIIRKASMWTLGKAFTHEIARERQAHHRLHQQGLYAWCRHPSYAGWMIWLIGTQILLRNMLCGTVFPLIAWVFFRRRVSYEDEQLSRFFSDEYRAYRRKTFSGIPGIP
jgi:protein-S-isoprenylcysteine O-methyltransferase